jgi:hypothetical protein
MTGPTAESDLLPHRLRQAQEKEKADASFRSGANITGVTSITAAAIPTESTALKPPSTATRYLPPSSTTAAPPIPSATALAATVPALSTRAAPITAKPVVWSPRAIWTSLEPRSVRTNARCSPSDLPSVTPVLASPPARKARAPAGGGSTSAVIRPGDFSSPTDFELRSGCISGTP